jgi:ABC-type taurine transport system ATPase subunit
VKADKIDLAKTYTNDFAAAPRRSSRRALLNVAPACCSPRRARCGVRRAAAGINRRAGYMFQAEALMPWRSAIDNVMVGLQYRGVPDAEARAQAQAWLARVGLGGLRRPLSRTSSPAACASAPRWRRRWRSTPTSS